jgi:serine/threonine-protein kinase
VDEEGRARVTDFGIARAGASDMTLTGSIMGTAQYLSPEQAQGFAVSAASDLYSIGVILYELLTGVVPFEGETAVAIAFKQVSAEPRPPSALNPSLPRSLDAVVLRALAKDPAERYADADQLIAALQHERDALPALAGAPAPAPAAAAVGHDPHAYHAAVPPPPATGSLLLAPAGAYEPQSGPPQRERSSGKRALWWALAVVLVAALAALALLLLTQKSKSVTVPRVTGQSEQAAGGTLRSAGLTPAPSLRSSDRVASGLVISQSPAPGSVVEKGAHVSIVVSGGPASAPLQSVAGLTAGKAAAKLRAAGYKTTVKKQASKTVEAGLVIGSEPPAETEVQEGRLVTLLVSSGPAPIRVPDVTGQSLQAAEATLTNAELAVGTVTKRVSSTQTPGTVLSQSPSTGTLHAGQTVELTIAQAPKEVEVPSVLGAAEAAAVAALTHAGFHPKSQPHATTEQAQVGVVIEQSPAGGAHARKGATVTIAVGVLGPNTTTTTTTTTTSTAPTTSTSTTPPPAAAG